MSMNRIKRERRGKQKYFVEIQFSGSVTIGIDAGGKGTDSARKLVEDLVDTKGLIGLIRMGTHGVKYENSEKWGMYEERVSYVNLFE